MFDIRSKDRLDNRIGIEAVVLMMVLNVGVGMGDKWVEQETNWSCTQPQKHKQE